MNILTVVGARPQFIKAAPVTKALRAIGYHEFLVHTGQHYDYGMSQVFFDEMQLPKPNINLGVGSGSHGRQTGEMLIGLEQVIVDQKPDWVLVYGDTNSTLAGALAAVKLQVSVAHVEAGLRSFNREMPEEHNRVLTDHCSNLLLCPTQIAVENLADEGIQKNVVLVGDTMYDAVLQFSAVARQQSRILHSLDLTPKEYVLVTAHRPYNTDNPAHLRSILSALTELGMPVIFPIHPRTRQKLADFDLLPGNNTGQNVRLIEPVGYLDMLMLEENARLILTDSGGIQKEAFFFRVPCVTMRTETEWVETVEAGWNILTSAHKDKIVEAVDRFLRFGIETGKALEPIYGFGDAAERICYTLRQMK